MLSINNQNPSTLGLGTVEDDAFRLSCQSMSSEDTVREQVRGGRDEGNIIALVGEMDGLVVGGGGEQLNLGAGVTIPLRLGDLDMCFPPTVPGSCNGNLDGCFKSCIDLRCSTTVLMVGLIDGSF